jgi:CubicO group peptidase (beta-lactamase class C family)
MNKKIIGIIICMLFIFSIFSSTCNSAFISEQSGEKTNFDNQKNSFDNSMFDLKIKLLMTFTHIPSLSACIIKNDTIVWSNAFGWSDIYNLKKAKLDTIYRVASITKTFTATALMQLYEKGLFDLDDNVSEYLPFDLKNPKYPECNITFRMLLAHQSSFCCINVESLFAPFEPVFGDDSIFNNLQWYLFTLIHLKDFLSGFYPEDIYPWIEEVMVPNGSLYYPEHWGDYPPGEAKYYTNIGYILLGYLIEQISGQSFEKYIDENILKPLSMHNSSFYIDEVNKNRLAVPYIWSHGIYHPKRHFELNCFNPAGGLFSDIHDFSKYLITFMNGGVYKGVRILNESTIEEMHRIQYPDGGYGLGWQFMGSNDTKKVGHVGQIPGFGSAMFFFKSESAEKLGIIYFWNENIYGAPIIGYFKRMKYTLYRNYLWNFFLEKALNL